MNEIISLEELFNDDTSPPKPIVGPGILLDKTLCLIHGKPKSGKTFFATNMALSIASGIDFIHFKVLNAKKVLYLSAEGGYYPNRERINKMNHYITRRKRVSDYPNNMFINLKSNYDLLDESSLQEIKETIDTYEIDVVFIDPFIRFHSGEENSAKDTTKTMKAVRELINDFDVSIVLVHHSGKDTSKGPRGSSVITSEYDSCIAINKKNNHQELSFDMRHVETPKNENIRFNVESLWFEPALELLPDSLISNGKIIKKNLINYFQNDLMYSKSKAYTMIQELEKSEKIKKISGKNYKVFLKR